MAKGETVPTRERRPISLPLACGGRQHSFGQNGKKRLTRPKACTARAGFGNTKVAVVSRLAAAVAAHGAALQLLQLALELLDLGVGLL